VYIAPACVASGEGSDHFGFGSYVRNPAFLLEAISMT
jgi:hypothetical protein